MPKTPAPGNGESSRQILAGIRVIVGEIQDLKRESVEDRQRADEDSRRADEDRKRSDAHFAEYVRRSEARDESMVRYLRAIEAGNRDLHLAIRAIGKYGRVIIENQIEDRRILREHTRLLAQIARGLDARGNGQARGNGRR